MFLQNETAEGGNHRLAESTSALHMPFSCIAFLEDMKKCPLTPYRASMIDRSESIQVQLGELVSLWGLFKRSTGTALTYRSVRDPKQLHH